MIPFSKEAEGEMKHALKQVGKKYIFTVKNLSQEDAGIYQVDVEGVNIFSTDFKSRFSQNNCLFVIKLSAEKTSLNSHAALVLVNQHKNTSTLDVSCVL